MLGSVTGEPGKTETANNKAELKYKRKHEVNYENEKKKHGAMYNLKTKLNPTK